MATEDDKINTGALATVVAVGAFGMIGVSLAVNALVRTEVGSLGAARDEVGEAAYRSMKEEQLQKLGAPAAWADRAKGQVAIPVERAMKIVLEDLKRSPWNASPSPPLDAGTDAAAETADAGTDATDTADAAAPEPPAPGPLSPSTPTPPTSAKPEPLAPRPSAAPAPQPKAPTAPTAAAPTPAAPTAAAPTPAAPPTPPSPPANP